MVPTFRQSLGLTPPPHPLSFPCPFTLRYSLTEVPLKLESSVEWSSVEQIWRIIRKDCVTNDLMAPRVVELEVF